VRFVGCSNFDAAQLGRALELTNGGLPRMDVTQCNYNLAVPDAERALMPLCQQQGVGVETYSPLGAGFLTGKYDAATGSLPPRSRFHVAPGHMATYFHAEKFAAVERLQRLSRRVGIPSARLAMAWVLRNEAVDCVLVGARTPDHFSAAVAALDLTFDPQWAAEIFGAGDGGSGTN
jgi:aryl-alcohol dehydrogenase-like predicted oxidoreductase